MHPLCLKLCHDGKALRHDGEVVHENGKKESSSKVCEEPME
jgi:hypothetical protein